ncbi:hypothetical protein [Armatimonas sp.]|uniref:hypothetical protein n=1 Tax=Armatimonas sp. TaxID=1872638 RepID=UPI00286AACD6|nr:hypothetical protein [Armatimonas sp.]
MESYEHFRIAVWVFGIPTIIALTVRAIRKMRAIRQRHEELLEEAEHTPQNAQQALAELYAEPQKTQKIKQRR